MDKIETTKFKDVIKRVKYINWFGKISNIVLDIIENGSFVYARRLEDDIWNNNNEFPNDGSEKSKLRFFAFETAKKWFEIIN
jgi:hypothetical protein